MRNDREDTVRLGGNDGVVVTIRKNQRGVITVTPDSESRLAKDATSVLLSHLLDHIQGAIEISGPSLILDPADRLPHEIDRLLDQLAEIVRLRLPRNFKNVVETCRALADQLDTEEALKKEGAACRRVPKKRNPKDQDRGRS